MPQWAGSCWYYLRYLSPHEHNRFVNAEAERYWMSGGKPGGVDLYVGGTEHAVLHLLYSRFWHKVLYDLGYASTIEPFQRLVNQGMILGQDNHKMSKSRGNVVNPDDVIADYGADALRLYEMFMGPLEATKPWSMSGVEGVYRFLARVWRLVMEEDQEGRWQLSRSVVRQTLAPAQRKIVHATIKKVTEDVEALAFNTAIAQLMIYVNEFTGAEVRPVEALRTLLLLLNPFAPHLTEELWERLGQEFAPGFLGLVSAQRWPEFNPAYLAADQVEVVLQVNGKLRDKMTVHKGLENEALQRRALSSPKIQEHIAGKTVRKVIIVPDKLVNVVAG
jgi:leucyl-tRNA synthetase